MVLISNSTDLIDNQGHAGGFSSPEQTPLDGIQTPESSNLTLQAPSHRLPSLKNEQALPPGPTYSPRFVSPFSYETVREIQPSNSYPVPSSAGATYGANSSSEARTRRDNSAPHLMPMSTQNDKSDEVQQPEHSQTSPLSPSASFRPPHSALYQRSFQRQPFPGQQYYLGHSAQPAEPPYAPPAPYGQHPGPAPGYMGQWGSQPSLPITLQSPVQFGYSRSFAHPGIHAQDTSSLGMPFNQHPHHGHNYGYPHALGHAVDAGAGDQSNRSTEDYAGPSSSYPEAAGAPHQAGAAPPTASHMSHHAYSPVHYSQPSASPHYSGYSPHSFAHSSPGPYSFTPGPPTYPQNFYGQLPPASPEAPSKGTAYWYLPPGGTQQYDTSAYQPGYAMQGYQSSMQMNRQEFDSYTSQAQAGPSSPPPFVGQSNQPMRLPSGAAHTRGQPPQSIPPLHARARSDAPHSDGVSPTSKKRSPHDTVSTSPPAASRKSYHPNPPSNRSEWVMWVGNVPSDATHDELWRFFNQSAPSPAPQPGTSAMLSSRQVRPAGRNDTDNVWGGVASVFLISRSNCAFVNFETEQHLASAVVHFNGKPIRPRDPRCPRLVCRVRKKDDDLRAGVGGQRGIGLHTRWVEEQKERGRERERELRAKQKGKNESEGESGEGTESSGDGPPTSPSTYLEPSSSSDPSPPIVAVSPNDELAPVHIVSEPRHGSSGNHSFTSTNSSFLANNFPKRYFILKSLTQFDLNLSLDRGIWATQPHNEGILDQAYRTSPDVYLIFGVNKSGEFFGYARMAGPIFHNERVDPVSWASRSSGSISGARGGPEAIKEEDEPGNDSSPFLSPTEHRLVDESPAPVTADEDARLRQVGASKDNVVTSKHEDPATAPAELHQAHKRMTVSRPPRNAETLPEQLGEFFPDVFPKTVSEGFLLDSAKVQARRHPPDTLLADSDGVRRKDTFVTAQENRRQRGKDAAQAVNAAAAAAAAKLPTGPRAEEQMQGEKLSGEGKPEGWGREFKIEWLRTERLPFQRTRHLRNPWNHDREVKVSRDGTELEPTVGQKLLDEWDKPIAEVEASPPTSPTSRGRGSKATVRATGATSGTSMAPAMPSLSPQVQRASASGAMGQMRRGAP